MDRSRHLSLSLPYLTRYQSVSPARTISHNLSKSSSLRSISQPSRILYVNGETTRAFLPRQSPSPHRRKRIIALSTKTKGPVSRICRSQSVYDLSSSHVFTTTDVTCGTARENASREKAESCEDIYHKGPFFPDVTASESGVSIGDSETSSLYGDETLSPNSSAFFEITGDSELDSLCEDNQKAKRVGRHGNYSDHNRSSPNISYSELRKRQLSSPSSDFDKTISRFQALKVHIPEDKKSLSSTVPLAHSTPHVSPRTVENKLSIKASWNSDEPMNDSNILPRKSHDGKYTPQGEDFSCYGSYSEDNLSDISTGTVSPKPKSKLKKKSSDKKTILTAKYEMSFSSLSKSDANPYIDSQEKVTNKSGKREQNKWWEVYNIETAESRKNSSDIDTERTDEVKEGENHIVKPIKVKIPLITAGKQGQEKLKRYSPPLDKHLNKGMETGEKSEENTSEIPGKPIVNRVNSEAISEGFSFCKPGFHELLSESGEVKRETDCTEMRGVIGASYGACGIDNQNMPGGTENKNVSLENIKFDQGNNRKNNHFIEKTTDGNHETEVNKITDRLNNMIINESLKNEVDRISENEYINKSNNSNGNKIDNSIESKKYRMDNEKTDGDSGKLKGEVDVTEWMRGAKVSEGCHDRENSISEAELTFGLVLDSQTNPSNHDQSRTLNKVNGEENSLNGSGERVSNEAEYSKGVEFNCSFKDSLISSVNKSFNSQPHNKASEQIDGFCDQTPSLSDNIIDVNKDSSDNKPIILQNLHQDAKNREQLNIDSIKDKASTGEDNVNETVKTSASFDNKEQMERVIDFPESCVVHVVATAQTVAGVVDGNFDKASNIDQHLTESFTSERPDCQQLESTPVCNNGVPIEIQVVDSVNSLSPRNDKGQFTNNHPTHHYLHQQEVTDGNSQSNVSSRVERASIHYELDGREARDKHFMNHTFQHAGTDTTRLAQDNDLNTLSISNENKSFKLVKTIQKETLIIEKEVLSKCEVNSENIRYDVSKETTETVTEQDYIANTSVPTYHASLVNNEKLPSDKVQDVLKGSAVNKDQDKTSTVTSPPTLVSPERSVTDASDGRADTYSNKCVTEGAEPTHNKIIHSKNVDSILNNSSSKLNYLEQNMDLSVYSNPLDSLQAQLCEISSAPSNLNTRTTQCVQNRNQHIYKSGSHVFTDHGEATSVLKDIVRGNQDSVFDLNYSQSVDKCDINLTEKEAYDNDYDFVDSENNSNINTQKPHSIQLLKSGQLKSSSLWTLQEETESQTDPLSPYVSPKRTLPALNSEGSNDESSVITSCPISPTTSYKHRPYETSDFEESDGNYSSLSTVESSSRYSREETPLSDTDATLVYQDNSYMDFAESTRCDSTATQVKSFHDFASGLHGPNSITKHSQHPFIHNKSEDTSTHQTDVFSKPGVHKTSVSFSLERDSNFSNNESIEKKEFVCTDDNYLNSSHEDTSALWQDGFWSDGSSRLNALDLDLSRISSASPAPSDISESSNFTCRGTAQVKKTVTLCDYDQLDNINKLPFSTSKNKPIKSALKRPSSDSKEGKTQIFTEKFEKMLEDFQKQTCMDRLVPEFDLTESQPCNAKQIKTSGNCTDMYRAYTFDDTEKVQNHSCIVVEDENMPTFRFKRFLKKSHTRRNKGKKILRFLSKLSCVSESVGSPDLSLNRKDFTPNIPDNLSFSFSMEPQSPLNFTFAQHEAELSVSPTPSNNSVDTIRSRTDSAYSSISESVSSLVSPARKVTVVSSPTKNFPSPTRSYPTPTRSQDMYFSTSSNSRDLRASSNVDSAFSSLSQSVSDDSFLHSKHEILASLTDVFDQLDVCEDEIDTALLNRLKHGHQQAHS